MDSPAELLDSFPRHHAAIPRSSASLGKKVAFRRTVQHVRRLVSDLASSRRTIIITGTNGKGSTASATAYLLRQSGQRVGVISSPAQRSDLTDMIKVNGRPISTEALIDNLGIAFRQLDNLRESEAPITHYFPICLAAYQYFDAEKVDVVIAETALGGAYDPTAPTHPAVCAFTNISKDHLDVFGASLDAVCLNKSRIIGKGSKVFLGDGIALPYAALIERYAVRVGAKIVPDVTKGGARTEPDVIYERGQIRIVDARSVCPAYQLANLTLACRLATASTEISQRSIEIDVSDVSSELFPPYRFEMFERDGVLFIFDSAHNEAGYRALLESLHQLGVPTPLHVLKGFSEPEAVGIFEAFFDPRKITRVHGYHPRVIVTPDSVLVDELDLDLLVRSRRIKTLLVCGIFLAPVIKARLLSHG